MRKVFYAAVFCFCLYVQAEETSISLTYDEHIETFFRYRQNPYSLWMNVVEKERNLFFVSGAFDSAMLQIGTFTEGGIYARFGKHGRMLAWSQSYTNKNKWYGNYEESKTNGIKITGPSFSGWYRSSLASHTLATDMAFVRNDIFWVRGLISYSKRIKEYTFNRWIIDGFPDATTILHYGFMSFLAISSLQITLDLMASESFYEGLQPSARVRFQMPLGLSKHSLLYTYYSHMFRDREGSIPTFNHEASFESAFSWSHAFLRSRTYVRYKEKHALWDAYFLGEISLYMQLDQNFEHFSLEQKIDVSMETDNRESNVIQEYRIDSGFYVRVNDTKAGLLMDVLIPTESKIGYSTGISLELMGPIDLSTTFTVDFLEEVTLNHSIIFSSTLNNVRMTIKLRILEEAIIQNRSTFINDNPPNISATVSLTL